ncbi:hypothetical protein C4A75_09565 [Brevibacillus laterosporus]|uniref:hypothetical protein n=1 Tax=Brevibacillus laterosporus TaxID=1465 RepID=UPI000CE4EA61|nr:hypothetical protein [Brevibacillus laterosporus]PPA85015.1 hypothetical protein C4A75_09565 [Brevibacillus laterosporus]
MRKYLLVFFLALNLVACSNTQSETLVQDNVNDKINSQNNDEEITSRELEDIYKLISNKDYLQAEKLLNNSRFSEIREEYKILSSFKNAMRAKDNFNEEAKRFKYMGVPLSLIPNSYSSLHKDDILKEKKSFLNEMNTLIKNGKIEILIEAFNEPENVIPRSIYHYLSFVKKEKSNIVEATQHLYEIPKEYDSYFSDEIKLAWGKYKVVPKTIDKINSYTTSSNRTFLIPAIGMTKEEVLNSAWGKPNNINKTTTANGVHEQWVYSIKKYVYFDNGYVTAIQE